MFDSFVLFIQSVFAGIIANCICAVIDRIMNGDKKD